MPSSTVTATLFAAVYVLAHATLLCLGFTFCAVSITGLLIVVQTIGVIFSIEWPAKLAVLPLLGSFPSMGVSVLFSVTGVVWTFVSCFDHAKFWGAHALLCGDNSSRR